MSLQDAIIAVILAEPGQAIQGKLALRQRLYVLGGLVEEDFGFSDGWDGPYSFDVTVRRDGLVAMGFVEELRRRCGVVEVYTYALTPDAEGYIQVREAEVDRYAAALERQDPFRRSEHVQGGWDGNGGGPRDVAGG